MAREEMTSIRVVISEGNTAASRAKMVQTMGWTSSELLARLLKRHVPSIKTDIVFPTDRDPKCSRSLESYDGILFTGSTSNIHKREPETLRQLDFARAAFDSGTPMFGICWGLQLAAVAAGGEVVPSRSLSCVCEVPFAPRINLTEAGQDHPLHASRQKTFDAFAFHSDEVTRLPTNSIVTARNNDFVQAAIIKGTKSTFWGVQYHPEVTGLDMGDLLRSSWEDLVASNTYTSRAQVDRAAAVMSRFSKGCEIPTGDSSQIASIEPHQFEFRPLEILNWLEHSVAPFVRERSMIRGCS